MFSPRIRKSIANGESIIIVMRLDPSIIRALINYARYRDETNSND